MFLTSMTSTPKSSKYVQDSDNTSGSPLAGPGPGGHKPSFKSTKLAKRARSFKEDLLEKISQMRSPNIIQSGRSQSPKNNRVKNDMIIQDSYYKNPTHELEVIAKQIQFALKHLRDVVSHQKLEVLPGNGTIILDTVWAINLAVKSIVSAENSTSITSATHQLFQSVAKLIKLCDETLITTEPTHINESHVDEVTKLVNDAVENLVQLVQEKLKHQNITYKTTPRSSYSAANLELPAQRNSLPDIPLTPRERQILEQTSGTPCMVRSSHSTESILRDASPPPKPPLPDGVSFNNFRSDINNSLTPPPLPPKKRNTPQFQLLEEGFNSDNSLIASSLERISLHSKSPEDSSSLLSASAGSLDSMLNHSRDDDDIRTMTECELFDESSNSCWETNTFMCNTSNLTENFALKRFSNADSGFGSLTSHRSSAISKRSSGSSHVSTTIQQYSKQSTSSSSTEIVKSESIMQNLQSLNENQIVKHSVQSFSHESSTSSSSNMTTLHMGSDDIDNINLDDDIVPPIPQKTKRRTERQPSPYDNVPDDSFDGELLVPCQMHLSQQSLASSGSSIGHDNRPPLPPKKKHIMAYMEMFGNCSHGNDNDFTRHSVHMVQTHWAQPPTSSSTSLSTSGLPTTQSCSFSHTSHSSRSSFSQTQTLLIPSLSNDNNSCSPLQSPKSPIHHHTTSSSSSSTTPSSYNLPPALPPKKRIGSIKSASPPTTPKNIINTQPIVELKTQVPDLLEHTTNNNNNNNNNNNLKTKLDDKPENELERDLMEELDINKYIVYKKSDEDGPEIRGGIIDALIIQATKATKNGAVTYQEAFLTTYRTFISPYELILKLIRRYNYFYCQADRKPSREAFALMVRVVSELTPSDLDNCLQEKLMDFVQQLILNGEITLAKALRLKHIERFELIQQSLTPHSPFIANITTRPARIFTLLDFKSEQIAEQMTLLDAELFMKIEIPEVLIWAQEQNEERSPNLTRFTEHFNKMSFWARTMILKVEAKDREKYFLKFIKIMKHLRKINNFNSYLALLSALDSAPVRRLEWQKHVQEGLKEYCTLIDSSSSFRAYRQALAETQPPCIPYIGLVLQDLTFVHIGNSNLLPEGSINFSKRWQQFNIVENMRKFKKCAYVFKKNERIISFYDNFDDHIGEDAMWQLSEKIKPRGVKKQANHL